MKKLTSIIAALMLLICSSAFAEIQVSNNGTRKGQFRKINLPAGMAIADNGDISTTDFEGTVGATTPAAGSFTTVAASTSMTDSGLTASTALTANSSKILTSSATTDTELGYIHGLTTPTGSGAIVAANTPTLITPNIGAATGTSLVATGDITFQSTLIANGRIGASSVLASSSSQISPSSLPYSIIKKSVGNNPNTEATTLPNGTPGQTLVLMLVGCGPSGTWTITPTTATGWASAVMGTRGQELTVLYVNGQLGWIIIGSAGSPTITIAA